MNISWVLSDSAIADPTLDVAELKKIGAFWGSWRTWRAFQTDNVICHDQRKANELITRNFQNTCNFYIPNSVYTSLDRPDNVQLYEGSFVHDVDRQEEIVAMHLVASLSDVVLLLGFDFSEHTALQDKLAEHRARHYQNLINCVIKDNTQVQWVIVDHTPPLRKNLQILENVTQDTLDTVVKYFL